MPESLTGWRIDKQVPISIILAILMQLGAFLWAIAKLDTRVHVLEQQRSESAAVNKVVYGMEQTVIGFGETLTRIEARQERFNDRLEGLRRD